MSTNYYAIVQPTGDETDVRKLHIGKASRSTRAYGLTTVSGVVFPDVASWISFLRDNPETVEVINEYGDRQNTEEFIAEYLDGDSPTSLDQIQWIRSHQGNPRYDFGGNLKVWDEPQPGSETPRYWIDTKARKLFYSGEFF